MTRSVAAVALGIFVQAVLYAQLATERFSAIAPRMQQFVDKGETAGMSP